MLCDRILSGRFDRKIRYLNSECFPGKKLVITVIKIKPTRKKATNEKCMYIYSREMSTRQKRCAHINPKISKIALNMHIFGRILNHHSERNPLSFR